jgi:hypothetical protein
LPAVVNSSYWDWWGHAYTQLVYFDNSTWKWHWLTIWTWGFDSKTWNSLTEVQEKLYAKYWYMTDEQKIQNASEFQIYASDKWNLLDWNWNTKRGKIGIATSKLEKNPEIVSNTLDFLQKTVDYKTNTKWEKFYRDPKIVSDNLQLLIWKLN